ncbi:MAG: right-handed parallel beta-helix repeat-containing protein, partial [Planctomycetota bacterium]
MATIQAGVHKLRPGDTLLVRGGTYRETVVFPRSGTAKKPITVRPYQDEKVIVSGCDPVTGWTKHDAAKNVWKTPMNWTLGTGRNQVFRDGAVMIEARHPNTPTPGLEMYVSDLSPLWPTFGEFSIPGDTRTTQPGRIVSHLLEGQPNDYWKGALYYGVHYEGWCAQTGVIESSKSGEITVGDRTNGWWFGSAYGGTYPKEHEEGRGMIVGHANALDQPGEWHWQDNVLYHIPPSGVDLPAATVEAKKRQLAFDLSDREHIHLVGLNIQAASLRLQDSAHCVVNDCHLSYFSHYTRQYGIGQIEHGRDTIKSGETGVFVGGHDNSFLNCSLHASAGAGFHLRGYHHTIHNCLIDEISYTAHYLNAI